MVKRLLLMCALLIGCDHSRAIEDTLGQGAVCIKTGDYGTYLCIKGSQGFLCLWRDGDSRCAELHSVPLELESRHD